VFGAWQADGMIGAQLVNEPGGLAWNDCHSTDPRAARAFYHAVFGFNYTTMAGPFDYTTIDGAGPGAAIGGIGEPDPSLPGAPSHWTVYFSVEDADETIATAIALGGTEQTAASDTPFGRMATLRDPQGALFKIMDAVAAEPPTNQE
jgi:predicted enzyme related to lactoylglutathione lyase